MKGISKATFSLNLFGDGHKISRSRKKSLKTTAYVVVLHLGYVKHSKQIFLFISMFSGILQYLKMLEKIAGHVYEMSEVLNVLYCIMPVLHRMVKHTIKILQHLL